MKIPDELKRYGQWVMWKYEERDGKKTKIPYTIFGRRASSTDSRTWCDWLTAVTALDIQRNTHGFDGIGFVFTKEDEFIGIDWDHVDIMDVIDEVKMFNSYAELSPSGLGIHCICKGTVPAGSRCRAGNREIYTHGRFFTFTGKHIVDTPEDINDCPPEVIDAFIKKITPQKSANVYSKSNAVQVVYKSQSTTKDKLKEVVKKCQEGKYADKFKTLFHGDWSGYNSHSEADFALCYIIARHTNNPTDVDIIFRKSKLFREKWNNVYYRTRTLNMAMNAAIVAVIESIMEE